MISDPKAPFWTKVGDVLKSYLTGPDGVSLAPGRLMGFVLFAWLIWSATFMQMNVAKSPHTIGDWISLMGQFIIYIPAIAVACVGLVLGIAPTDSGGKWWSRDASPPPPPTDTPTPPDAGK